MRSFRAPGRVNLIGGHTDYNEGYVLPMAIGLGCLVRATPRSDGMVHVTSLDLGEDVQVAADGSTDPAEVEPAWGRYAAGVVRALAAHGRDSVGLDAVLSSTVPLDAGLSSSGALEVALALALCDAADLALTPIDLARACQEAEALATGIQVGIMDQLTSLSGRQGNALLIDCRSLEIEPIPLPPRLTAVIVHSGVTMRLADSAYAERRRTCEMVAARLGVRALRDASAEQVADEPRARHVVSENARVLEAARALSEGAIDELGPLLAASHASLRDDFEVSIPELDALAEELVAAGALGARMTGEGFGGCVVGLASRDMADAVVEKAAGRYWARTGRQPRAFVCRPADGAGMERERTNA